MQDTPAAGIEAAAVIRRIDAVPTLLQVLCEMTGMRCAMVACITGNWWVVCAVKDELQLGFVPGTTLPLAHTLCARSTGSAAPLMIPQASLDPRYRERAMVGRYGIESHFSVPIVLGDGQLFGSLCALDTRPAAVPDERVRSMFGHFASLIASRLDDQLRQQISDTALLDERAASELREQFIAILGHDLRNPLQAVYFGSDLLERKLADEELRIHATRIKTNTRRMSLLIDDVLDFARGRLGGGIGLELTEIDNINIGLATVIQELEDTQPDCRIISRIAVSRSVRCDLGRLQQVASNLLGNALTHGDPATAVEISAHADDTDLVLEVWNAGRPIPPESIGKIFEPFWRHSVSASRNGLGLGLHICSQIVHAHHGRISVTSTLADGTRFTARLPLTDLPRVASAVPALTPPPALAPPLPLPLPLEQHQTF